MAKKFSGFSTSITPDKTSTSQFIVGYSGQDNAQWTMKQIADEIGGSVGDTIFTTSPTSTVPTGQVIKLTDSIKFQSVSGSIYGGWIFKTALAGIGANEYATISYGSRTFLSHYRANVGWAFGGASTVNSFHFNTGTTTMSDGWSVRVHGGTNTNGALIVKGAGLTSSTTALAVQDSDGADIFNVTDDGNFTLGKSAVSSTPNNVVIGGGATDTAASNSFNVIIGKDASVTGTSNQGCIILGDSSLGTASGSVAVGSQAKAQAANAIAIGQRAQPTGDNSITLDASGSGLTTPSTANAFGVYMTSNATPDFEVIGNEGMIPPSITTIVRDAISSPIDGSTIYNTTDNKLQFYDGTAWTNAAGGDNIYTSDGTITSPIHRKITLAGTSLQPNKASLEVSGAVRQGDFKVGNGYVNNKWAWSWSMAANGFVAARHFYQAAFYCNSTHETGAAASAGINYLSISAQGLEHHKVSVGVGINGTMNDRLVVKGASDTNTKHSVRVLDINDASMFSIRNDGAITLGKGATIQSTSGPQYSVVIGYGAKDKASAGNGVEAVAIGRLAVGHQNGVAIGGQAACLGASAVAVGGQAQAKATGVSLGYQAGGATAGSSAVSIGKFAQAKATGSIAIGTNTGLTGANSIVLNATTGVTSTTTTDTFAVYMSDAATPDFAIVHDGNSYITGTGNFGFGNGNTSPTATVDIDGTFRLRSATNVNGKVLTADANGNGTWQTAGGGSAGPAISIENTNGGDVDLYDDNIVRLWLDDGSSDDIELEITNYASSTSSTYHVNYTNFEGGASSARTTTVDLNQSGATSTSTLDFSFTDDECMKLRIWSPRLGLGVGGESSGFPFYEITIVKSGSLYTGAPVITSVIKSTS